MNKGMKRKNNYEVGNLVKILVPKIDCFGTNHPILLCKILEKINDQYQLGFQFEVINIFYSLGKIDSLDVN